MGNAPSTASAPYGAQLNKLSAGISCNIFGQNNVVNHVFTVTSPVTLFQSQSFQYSDFTIEVDIPQLINQYFINSGATQYSAQTLVEFYAQNTDAGVIAPSSSIQNVSLTTSSTFNFPGGNGVLAPIPVTLKTGDVDTLLKFRSADTSVQYQDANGNQIGSSITIDCGTPSNPLDLSYTKVTSGSSSQAQLYANGVPGAFPPVPNNAKATVAHVPLSCRDGEGEMYKFNTTVTGVVPLTIGAATNYYINETSITFTVDKGLIGEIRSGSSASTRVQLVLGTSYSAGYQLNFTDNTIPASIDASTQFTASDPNTPNPLQGSGIGSSSQDAVITLPSSGTLQLGPFKGGVTESPTIETAFLNGVSGTVTFYDANTGSGGGYITFGCTVSPNAIFVVPNTGNPPPGPGPSS